MPHSNYRTFIQKSMVAAVLVLGALSIGATSVLAQVQSAPPAQQPAQTTPKPAAPKAETPKGSQTLANPLKFNSLNELLDGVLKAVIQLGTIILTLALMWTGFKFIEARGNEEKIRSARTALMYTVIGGLILLGATAIKEVLTSTISSITP